VIVTLIGIFLGIAPLLDNLVYYSHNFARFLGTYLSLWSIYHCKGGILNISACREEVTGIWKAVSEVKTLLLHITISTASNVTISQHRSVRHGIWARRSSTWGEHVVGDMGRLKLK